MRFLVTIVIISLLSFLAGIYFPWWSIAVVAFITSVLVRQSPKTSFWSGFIAVFLLWVILAALITTANNNILATRIAELLGIGKNPVILVFVTGIVGGFVAGLGALTGSYFRGGKSW